MKLLKHCIYQNWLIKKNLKINKKMKKLEKIKRKKKKSLNSKTNKKIKFMIQERKF